MYKAKKKNTWMDVSLKTYDDLISKHVDVEKDCIPLYSSAVTSVNQNLTYIETITNKTIFYFQL